MVEDNRKDIRIVESIAASQPAWFRIWSPNITAANSAYASAFTAGIGAGFAGIGLAQWLVKINEIPAHAIVAASMTVGFGSAVVVFVLVYFFDRGMSTSRYGADYPDEYNEEVEHPRAMLPTADRSRAVALTGVMRSQLQRFGRFYPVIKTPAILAWTKSKYLTRKQIEDIRAYLVQIGAAVSKETAQGIEIELTEWGRAQLPLWAADDFAGLIELGQSPLPPEAG